MGGLMNGLSELLKGFNTVDRFKKEGFDYRQKEAAAQAARDQELQKYQQQNEDWATKAASEADIGSPEGTDITSLIPSQVGDTVTRSRIAARAKGAGMQSKSYLKSLDLTNRREQDAQRQRDALARLDDQQAFAVELETLREKNRSGRKLTPAELDRQKWLEGQAELNRSNARTVAGMRGTGGTGMGGGSVSGKFRARPGMSPDEIMSELEQVDPAAAAHVKGLLAYQTDPKTFNTRTGEQSYLTGIASLVDPSYDQRQYGVSAGVRKDFTYGKSADKTLSLNTVMQHLGELRKSAAPLENTFSQDFNTFRNNLRTRFGDDAVTQFDWDATAVTDEIANVFKSTGVTDQAVDQWKGKITSASSPAQMMKGWESAVKLLQGRLGSLEHRYTQGMGAPGKFSIVSPGAQAVAADILPGGLTGVGAPSGGQHGKPVFKKRNPDGSMSYKDADGNVWKE
jgi:hypothetical protein